ncbi:MAG: transposase, partial [Tyzzerella sp.]|nr:transposase [Tyzzerella sp.]
MVKDTGWKRFLSDDARYADVINGVACKGEQVVNKEDLQEMDTQTGMFRGPRFIHKWTQSRKGNVKVRDCLRKVAFGTNFAIIGIENQETMDYSIPLRNMAYDVDAYERQATKIRKETRKKHKGLSAGEYLYGFKKDDKLLPAVTVILYSGSKSWDGPKTLHEILDFTDIP